MSLVLAILALGFLIIVHEAGHYFVARTFNMRVERFSIGFGPSILRWRSRETQFQLAVIPLGGFVQIAGMNPHEEVDLEDPRVYPNRPTWQRFLTIFAGPATNYLSAIFVIFAVYACSGIETDRLEVGNVLSGQPADGKLYPGDVVLSVNGRDVTYETFKDHIQESKGAPLALVVRRDGNVIDVELTPAFIPAEGDIPAEYRVGIERERERMPVSMGRAAYASLVYPWDKSQEILQGLYMVATGKAKGDVTGPIGITVAIRERIQLGWVRAFEVLALLNVYLGLFNLLPLPALDGGRLAFLGYELAFRRRPNPKVEASVHMVGFVMLFVLMILVMFKDIRRLFT